MRTAVIGAGLAGLSAAHQLAARGRRVVLFERADAVGGLARGFEIGGQSLERYYHHIFTHDRTFQAYVDSLGLADQLEWWPSRMGVVGRRDRLHPFTTPLDLLRFPDLDPLSRLRFGWGVFRARAIKDYRELEHRTAASWLIEVFGQAGYQTIWRPLLAGKFGHHAKDISAVWMWKKIALRGDSRDGRREQERLGYVRDGFQTFHEALAQSCRDSGVEIRLGARVTQLAQNRGHWTIFCEEQAYPDFDQVLVTSPPRVAQHLAEPFLSADEQRRLANLRFQGAIVAVLQLDRPLSHYYWLNVNAEGFPFGGVIEHTNLIPPERYGGAHIVYLSRYIEPDAPLFHASNDDVLEQFVAALPRINPTFDRRWVKEAWVFRDAFAQPVIPCGYRDEMPPMATSAPGLFLANMSHIYPEDRGMNYALALGMQASELMLTERHAIVPATSSENTAFVP
ncbi:MAG TPA: NAD(P)/FAD-dependent oxidoreductase [Oscillatoriaceae cyanobacterium]